LGKLRASIGHSRRKDLYMEDAVHAPFIDRPVHKSESDYLR